ncbi:MAG: ferritin-like domain-containing protein [Stigonema ocellatum SAG 48.90 = DSM 106950]|nr:ferritin-like domain-containing protein [Stigonema ocellatum SAG 48.90 = DSM 106950]
MKIGSQTHKELFCRSFMESHQNIEPEQLMWPKLDGPELERLRQIPFWEEALNTELEAGAKIDTYLPMITDPLVREAVALMGEEEAAHGRLFQYMIQHYGIDVSGHPPAKLPTNIEQAFIDFGYGECLDAFLGFGLFKIARQSGFLPEPMFTIFDRLLQDETRHIVFFVNWVAYLQASRGREAKLFRGIHSLWHYGKAVQRVLAVIGRSSEQSGNSFSATEASVFLDGFSVEKLISTCLQENARRMSFFDDRLLQPELLPSLAQVALSGIKLVPKRQSENTDKNLSKVENS